MSEISQNLLQVTKFQVMFDRIPNTQFFITKANIPGFSISEGTQPTQGTILRVPGTKTLFEPWMMTFNVDANMASWYDIYLWMQGLGMPQNSAQYPALANNAVKKAGSPPEIGVRAPYSDATLTIYTAKNNVNLLFSFKDLYPFELSTIDMDYGGSAQDVITCQAKFRYSYYTFSIV